MPEVLFSPIEISRFLIMPKNDISHLRFTLIFFFFELKIQVSDIHVCLDVQDYQVSQYKFKV